MRQYYLIIVLAIALLGSGGRAQANCVIIDQLDKLHILQTRLANNPDTVLFRDDIRQLRVIISNLSDSDTLQAVDGNAIMGRGAGFVRFLQNTQNLLQGVSLDDPYSVRPHFTRGTRQNLQDIGGYLTDLRCTDTQIAIAQAEAATDPIRASSDAEDLQQVAEVLNELAQEVFQLRTLVIGLATALFVGVTTPLIRRWLLRRRRRAQRHNAHCATLYRWSERTIKGMLIDINCHGTKLRHEADNPLPPGAPVDIAIEGEWTGGTVIWSNVHYSGVKFSRMIDLSQVYAICAADRTRSATQNGAPKDAVS